MGDELATNGNYSTSVCRHIAGAALCVACQQPFSMRHNLNRGPRAGHVHNTCAPRNAATPVVELQDLLRLTPAFSNLFKHDALMQPGPGVCDGEEQRQAVCGLSATLCKCPSMTHCAGSSDHQ